MRIAVDCRAAYKGMGGIGRYTWSLLQEYAQVDSADDFVCYFTELDPPGPLNLPSRFIVRRFQAGMIDERFDQLMLPTLLEQDGIDVYHNPIFAVPVIRTRTHLVSTVHDVVFKRHPELVEQRLARYLDQATVRASKYAGLIVTVSTFSKHEIKQLYGVSDDRILVIPNGMTPPGTDALNAIRRDTSPGFGLESGSYVLYVGSLEPKKNIKGLLDAFQIVAKHGRFPGLKLVLAGSSGAHDFPVEQWVDTLGLRGRVVLPGYVPEEQLDTLYRSALMFVYPSLYEGFGLPPLEAMARGIPTIVSASSSLPEVVGDAGMCIDPRRPDLFAEAIMDLASDADRRSDLAERGRRRALQYTWKRSALRHLEAFKSLGVRHHENIASRV